MGESVCFWRLGDSGWRGPGRVVAIDDYIATVKISNQKYDCRHEDCLPVGTEFAKLKANWAEVNEKEEDLQPTIVMTRFASKQKAQITERGEAGQSTASASGLGSVSAPGLGSVSAPGLGSVSAPGLDSVNAPTNLESSVSSSGQGSSVSTPWLESSVSTPRLIPILVRK